MVGLRDFSSIWDTFLGLLFEVESYFSVVCNASFLIYGYIVNFGAIDLTTGLSTTTGFIYAFNTGLTMFSLIGVFMAFLGTSTGFKALVSLM